MNILYKLREILIPFVPYIFLVLVFFMVFISLLFKYKYKFWLDQPIYNKYDIRLWNKNGIIKKDAKWSKYFNSLCYSSNWSNTPSQKKIQLHFILNHTYNYYKNLKTNMSIENLNSLLTKHNNKSYITLYYKNPPLNSKLTGTLISKPIVGRLYNKEIHMYFWDFICKKESKVLFELIRTHYKRQMDVTENKIFLWRTNEEISIINPVIEYQSYLFSIKFFPKKIKSKCKNVKFITITSGNYRLFINMFYKLYSEFDCFLHVNISNLTHLLDKNLLFITLIMLGNKPLSCYFFKNTHTVWNNSPVISLIGSYKGGVNTELFLEGFYNSIILLCEKIQFKNIIIEDLSFNTEIINNTKKYKCFNTYTSYYYFYNFIYKSFTKNQVLFLL